MKKRIDKFVEVLREHIIFSMIVSGILGAIISWLFGWVLPTKPVEVGNLPQKELTCTLNFSQNLINKRTNDDKFQILYDGEEVESPYIYNITIKNTGSYEISNEDFKDNFVTRFEDCGKIVSAEIISSTNKEIYDEVLSNAQFENDEIIFTDFFLNPNEEFTFSVITYSKAKSIVYDYRIAGVSNIVLRNTQQEKVNNVISIFIVLLAGSVIFLCYIVVSNKIQEKRFERLKKEYDEKFQKFMEEYKNE